MVMKMTTTTVVCSGDDSDDDGDDDGGGNDNGDDDDGDGPSTTKNSYVGATDRAGDIHPPLTEREASAPTWENDEIFAGRHCYISAHMKQ